jgi:hypothetical protein
VYVDSLIGEGDKMPVAITVLKKGGDGRSRSILGTLALSGTYPTNGDPVDFGPLDRIQRQPDIVEVVGKAGFVYQYDVENKKLFVYCNTAGGANGALGEHTNATYVAGVSGDTVRFEAIWFA